MDAKEKERIFNVFIEIARDVIHFLSSTDSEHFADSLVYRSYEEESETILSYLLEDCSYFLKFSEEYLEKLVSGKVRELISKLLQKEPSRFSKKAREVATQLLNELDGYTEIQTVYLPVSGIILQIEEEKLEIGNIIFQRMTQERIDEVLNSLFSTIMVLKYTSEEKEQQKSFLSRVVYDTFKDPENATYAVYQVNAEPIRAKERARDECYKVFDLFRYALPALYSRLYPMQFSIPKEEIDATIKKTNKPSKREKRVKREDGQYIAFGLQGEVGVNIIRHTISLSNRPGFSWSNNNTERFIPLTITQMHIKVMTDIGVFEVAKILKGEETKTKFKETLLRSIHWFANAQTLMQPEYVVLSLVSSLEAFLNPPSHEGVTGAVVEGAAILGGEVGYEYVKKRFGEHYDIRSILSHGDEAIVSERNIFELRQVAFYVIHLMIQRREEFLTQKDFFEMIKKMREEIKNPAQSSTRIAED